MEFNYMGKLIQLRKKQQHSKKIKCCFEECSFTAEFFSDFRICLDDEDNGMAACPDCETIQPFSYFLDSLVETNGDKTINEKMFENLIDTFDIPDDAHFDETVARFNTIYSEVPDEQRCAN